MGYPQYSTNSGRRRQYMDEEPRRRSYISGRQQPFHSEYASPDYTRGRDARQTTQAYSGMRNTAAAATAPVNFDPEHGTSYGDYVRTPTGERVGAASAEIDPNTGAYRRKVLAPVTRNPTGDVNRPVVAGTPVQGPVMPGGKWTPSTIDGKPAAQAIAEARKAAEENAPKTDAQKTVADFRNDARANIQKVGFDEALRQHKANYGSVVASAENYRRQAEEAKAQGGNYTGPLTPPANPIGIDTKTGSVAFGATPPATAPVPPPPAPATREFPTSVKPDLNTPFNPEGSGYDYKTALDAGMTTDENGHWGSLNPKTGMVLKGAAHPTHQMMVDTEREMGNEIVKRPDRRYYSVPKASANQPVTTSTETARPTSTATAPVKPPAAEPASATTQAKPGRRKLTAGIVGQGISKGVLAPVTAAVDVNRALAWEPAKAALPYLGQAIGGAWQGAVETAKEYRRRK